MSDAALITFPNAGDKTLSQFLAAQAIQLGEPHRELLNEIARAITERGWLQPVDAIVAKLVDRSGLAAEKLLAAIPDLVHRRLLTLDDAGTRFNSFLGSISFVATPHRARLDNRIDVYTFGGLELLAVNPTLLRPVHVFTQCPVTKRDLELRIDKEQIVGSSFPGISGFMAEWNGSEPLAEVAARSPLFANDLALEQWVGERPGIQGTELPSDLLLWLGMEAAKQLGALRFKLIGHQS